MSLIPLQMLSIDPSLGRVDPSMLSDQALLELCVAV